MHRCLQPFVIVAALTVSFATAHGQPPPPMVEVRVYDHTNTVIPGMSQTLSGGSDVLVTFTAQVTQLRTIRLYDSGTDGNSDQPTLGIGKLTNLGSASSTARINILIADADQHKTVTSRFPATTQQAAALTAGLTTFGGSSGGASVESLSGQSHDYDLHPWATLALGGNQPPFGSPNIYNWDGLGNVHPSLTGLIIPDPSLRRQTVLAAVVSQATELAQIRWTG